MNDVRSVGVFDSGVGGLSILQEIHRQAPHESVVYVADQAWAPYGERALDEVRVRAFAVVGELLARDVKAVVVACNTASAAALYELRDVFPTIPFVGMEPAVKPAAALSDRGVVGVLATRATFQGELYASVVDRHANGARVIERAGTGLVELIEGGEIEGVQVEALLRQHLEPMLDVGIDTLVLGCTHYAFVADAVRTVLGDGVRLIDPSPSVARQLLRVLNESGLAAAADGSGSSEYLTTGDPQRLVRQVEQLLARSASAAHASF